MAQTLEELKAENLESEQVETKQEKPVEKKPAEEVEEVSKAELKSEVKDDSDDDDGSDEGKEAWMLTDEQTSEDGDGEKKFTGGDVAAAKRKLKGKLQAETEEKNEWKLKYEALKNQGGNSGGQKQQEAAAKNRMPKLRDFSYNEDEFEEAMGKWVQQSAVSATSNASNETSQAEAKRLAQERSVKAIDDHYLRVDELVTKSNIAPEVYQAADTAVRRVVESVLPNSGDVITDELIARLGEGSEKVIYHLGRNTAKREQFGQLLREDSTGLSAAMMLGQLKIDLSGQAKRGSNASPPSGQLNGDASGSSGGNLKRKYENAKDVQTRFDIKRQAKGKGIDVSGW